MGSQFQYGLSFPIWQTVIEMKKHDRRIALRLPSKERARIQQLINEGKYENLSQMIRVALKDFLERR